MPADLDRVLDLELPGLGVLVLLPRHILELVDVLHLELLHILQDVLGCVALGLGGDLGLGLSEYRLLLRWRVRWHVFLGLSVLWDIRIRVSSAIALVGVDFNGLFVIVLAVA